jgi:hypothetical protein
MCHYVNLRAGLTEKQVIERASANHHAPPLPGRVLIVELVGLILFLAAVALSAQTPQPAGKLKGRVFAISGAGALLPARMAEGYLIRCGSTPACAYLLNAEAEMQTKLSCVAESCRYLAATNAFRQTSEKYGPFAKIEADEEGYFTVPSGGRFLLFIVGQAGASKCIWQDFFDGKGPVKLSKPHFVYDTES